MLGNPVDPVTGKGGRLTDLAPAWCHRHSFPVALIKAQDQAASLGIDLQANRDSVTRTAGQRHLVAFIDNH